jgi:hypothetical protein
VFDNRVLRIISGPEMNEMEGVWRKLHIEGLQNLNSSPSIIRMIKSRRMISAEHVERMGENNNAYVVFGVMEGSVFWDITPCSLMKINQQF